MSDTPSASHEDQSKSLLIAKIYFQGHLKSKSAEDYLAVRGLSAQSCRRFEIGYAPDKWRGLVDHFSSHRMRMAAKDAGVITEKQDSKKMLDVFRDRLTFPIHDDAGAIVGFGGRLLPQPENSASESGYVAPKYINTRETDQFNKSQMLYGLHQNRNFIHESKSAIVVEGYMDVVCMDSAGISNGVAPMGTSLTVEHLQKLQTENVRSIYLCFDGDNSGQSAALRSAELAAAHVMPTTEVFIIVLPGEHDPDTYIKAHGAGAFNELIANALTMTDFISQRCMSDNMRSIEAQALYLDKLEPFIEASSTVTRNALLETAQHITSLPAQDLYEGKYYDASGGQLCPLSANWSRMIVHGQTTPQEVLEFSASGTFDIEPIHELAKGIADGRKPHSDLYHFALAHGPLSPQELEDTQEQIEVTLDSQNLAAALQRLKDMPFDASAKRDIRSLIRFG